LRLAPGLALKSESGPFSASAKPTAIRVKKNALPPRQIAAGIGKAMAARSEAKPESGLGETIRVVIHALLIALVIRTFLFQPFNIPSGSMKATLLVGDYLFVSKYSYGYTHYSIPFSPPLFSGRVFGSEPSRGDIVVFRLPKDDSTDYIKRVIGLPGDRIQMKDGLLHINDKPVQRERLSDFIGEDPCGSDATARVKRWKETLPNGVSYETLDCVDNGFYDNTIEYTVPSGNFFMMGDNRDNSTDSRVLSAVGYVPFENLIGRAQMIFFSIAEGEHAWMFWRWPAAVRWNRLFKIVR
jgi:signal peptidase I